MEPVPFAPPVDETGEVESAIACDLETLVCEGGELGAPGQDSSDCE